eukprot:5674630-Prymnesium_polylepis.1
MQLVPKGGGHSVFGPNAAGGNVTDRPCAILAPSLQAVTQTTYAPYVIDRVSCYKHASAWHQSVIYDVRIQRTSSYFVFFFIVPAVLFTYMSFAVFHMAFKVGERLGFGVTLVLTTEVNKNTLAAYIP